MALEAPAIDTFQEVDAYQWQYPLTHTHPSNSPPCVITRPLLCVNLPIHHHTLATNRGLQSPDYSLSCRAFTLYVPMVLMKVDVKASSEKRNRMQVLPTPESPISNSLNSRSYVFLAIAQFTRRVTSVRWGQWLNAM